MTAATALSTLHHREEVMGTVVTFDVVVDHGLPVDVRHRLGRACEVLHRADAVFSTWKHDSPMSRVRGGELAPANAPPEVAEVLETCAVLSAATDGWFDPWAMPGGVDPTGFVKGWAAQRARDVLLGDGVRSAIVNAAGDIATFGRQPSGAPFRIGVVDPNAPRALACVIEVDGAVATSARYERGAHLVDPRTGRPQQDGASATVVGPDLGVADAFATALAVAGSDGLAFVGAADGYEALVIDAGGRFRWTPAFPFAADQPAPLDRHPASALRRGLYPPAPESGT